MLSIKISYASDFPFSRQIPQNYNFFDDVNFVINKEIAECDFWVVYDGLKRTESTICSKANTILFTGEPSSVRTYNKDFIRQFGKIVTTQKSIKHENLIFSQPCLPWLVGIEYDSALKCFRKDKFWSYKDFDNADFWKHKSKLVSLISSNKGFTKGHKQRVKFISRLKDELGDQLDLYGNGYLPIPDKINALSDYKYTIVIENSQHPDYWTEKLSDAMLCDCLPIYHGCSNIDKYFDSRKIISININKIEQSIDAIKQVINSNIYENTINEIINSKQLILNDYNFFNYIKQLANVQTAILHKERITIHPEKFSIKDKIQTKINRLF